MPHIIYPNKDHNSLPSRNENAIVSRGSNAFSEKFHSLITGNFIIILFRSLWCQIKFQYLLKSVGMSWHSQCPCNAFLLSNQCLLFRAYLQQSQSLFHKAIKVKAFQRKGSYNSRDLDFVISIIHNYFPVSKKDILQLLQHVCLHKITYLVLL